MEGVLKKAEKVKLIKQWYKDGKIKRLDPGWYFVPSEGYIMGITPSLAAEVLEKEVKA